MLRISTGYRIEPDDGGAWVLRLEGNLQGEWVDQLRRQWQELREPEIAPIRVELREMGFVDLAGRLLLDEMRRSGVRVAWEDARSSLSSWPV